MADTTTHMAQTTPDDPASGNGPGHARRKRWPALDGLRGIAILLVLLYHFHWPGPALGHLVGGWGGVDIFFVLSGFLITDLLVRERERTGRLSFRSFYKRRWKRLGPALLVMVFAFEIIVTFLPWPGGTTSYPPLMRLRDLGTLFSLGINWWGIFGVPTPPFMGAMWSLAVEEQFYLIWPLVIVWAYRGRTTAAARRLMWIVAAGAAAVSAVECLALYPTHTNQVRIYFATDTRAQGLLIGALVALAWHTGRRLDVRSSRACAIAGLLIIAVVALRVADSNPFRVNGAFTVLAAATAAVVLHVLWEPTSAIARGLQWSPLRWVGRRSYALYLWHAPIATFLYAVPGSAASTRFGWPGYVGGIALSFVLAELSWRLVEQPKWWGEIRRRPVRSAAQD